MQFNQNIIQLLDMRGEVIGTVKVPSSIKLADLTALKALGAASVKVTGGAQ